MWAGSGEGVVCPGTYVGSAVKHSQLVPPNTPHAHTHTHSGYKVYWLHALIGVPDSQRFSILNFTSNYEEDVFGALPR